MADCSSIESLLNELLDKLDGENCCDELRADIFQIQKDVLGLKDSSRIQRIKLERLIIEFTNFKRTQPQNLLPRLQQAEREIKFTDKKVNNVNNLVTKIDKRLKKLQNDFNFAVKRFTTRFTGIDKKLVENDKKNKLQDEKIKAIDDQLTPIKAAIALIIAAGGLAAYIAARLAPLIAKQKAVDIAIEAIKRLLQRERDIKPIKGDKGDRGERGERGQKGDTGSKGDKGDSGNNGNTGAKGDKGLKGDQGVKGDKGDRGLKGDKGQNGKDGDPGVKGDTGEAGAKGDPGVKGDTGEAGAKGDPGVKGDTGETGAKGDPGVKGDTGEAGAKGDPGVKGDKGDDGEVQIVEVEKTVLVYQEPDFTEILAKILELRNRLIYPSNVEIPSSCSESNTIQTSDLPSFLNAIEDKLTAIEKLICDTEELEAYSLGSFEEPSTVNLQPETRFVKISVTALPVGIGTRFGRAAAQPNNYQLGFIAFESNLGLSPENPWEWEQSYFYPEKENKPSKLHVYARYPDMQYTITGYKVKL